MTIKDTVYYNQYDSIASRFIYHVQLGLQNNIGDRAACPKNTLEKVGDYGLWFVEELPKIVWRMMKDPKIVTVALTVFALLAASFVFYPATTFWALCHVVKLLGMPFHFMWFSAYIFVVGTIISAACRAEGRFWNTALMDEFYRKKSHPPKC